MRLAATAAVLAAAALATGCESEPEARSAAAEAEPVGDSSAGSVVQYADCGDWMEGTEAERYATVRELRSQLTPQQSRTAESPLPDEDAYAALQKTCSSGANVDSMRLYKLYVRMQGFAPLGG